MTQEKIDFFLASKRKLFSPAQLELLAQELSATPDKRLFLLQSLRFKNPSISLLFAILMGHWGIDRFYLGNIAGGFAKLVLFYAAYIQLILYLDLLSDSELLSFTTPLCAVLAFIWIVVDCFTAMRRCKEKNLELIMPYL